MRPTAAQLAALKLAFVNYLRYYKGGWYSIPSELGDDQRAEVRGVSAAVVVRGTVDACVARGWLSRDSVANIYAGRWTITDAGRTELARSK